MVSLLLQHIQHHITKVIPLLIRLFPLLIRLFPIRSSPVAHVHKKVILFGAFARQMLFQGNITSLKPFRAECEWTSNLPLPFNVNHMKAGPSLLGILESTDTNSQSLTSEINLIFHEHVALFILSLQVRGN